MSTPFIPNETGSLSLRLLRQELKELQALTQTGRTITESQWQTIAYELTKEAVYAGVSDQHLREALSRFMDPELIFSWVRSTNE